MQEHLGGGRGKGCPSDWPQDQPLLSPPLLSAVCILGQSLGGAPLRVPGTHVYTDIALGQDFPGMRGPRALLLHQITQVHPKSICSQGWIFLLQRRRWTTGVPVWAQPVSEAGGNALADTADALSRGIGASTL